MTNFMVLAIYHVLTFSFLISIVSAEELSNNDINKNNNKTQVVQKKWLTQLFLEAEIHFDLDSSVNSQCLRDYNFYKTHLEAQTGWAIRILESAKWPTTSLLAGQTVHLGNYDECLLVSIPRFQGKYCLIEGSYNYDKLLKNNSIAEAVEWPSDELSVWEIFRMFEKNPVRADRKTIQWALCMPSTCQNTDLEISLRKIIYPLFQSHDLEFHLNADHISCHVKEETKYSPEYYNARMFFVVIFLLVCLSTTYDVVREPKKGDDRQEWTEFLTSFSLARNFLQLLQYSKKNDYGLVYAMKVVSLVIIIYGHRRIYSLGYPSFDIERYEINFKKNINYFELTHFTFVDVFFMLTGFLTFHLNFLSISKHGIRYWYVAIIHRWLRLIPTFGALVVFIIYILPYISDGPLWDAKVSHEISHCKATWWANILAINNVVQTENQCLIVSWYISADMQIAVVGFGLLYITSKNRTWGWMVIIFTFILGALATFTVAYVNNYQGVLPTYVSFLRDPNSSKDFINFYGASYTRIGPYLIGVMTALITRTLREKNFQFSTNQKVAGLILAFIVGEGYLHLGFKIVYEFEHQYNVLEHALYAATYRSVFVLSYALMLCIYFTTGFRTLDIIYENRLFAAFGRLTYSVFLVNTVVQLFQAASQRSVLSDSIIINRFWWVASDAIYTYFFGACLFLFLEAPTANLSKLIKQKLLKRTTKRDTLPITTELTPPHQKKLGLI